MTQQFSSPYDARPLPPYGDAATHNPAEFVGAHASYIGMRRYREDGQ